MDCKDCHEKPRTNGPRCLACHRKWKTDHASRQRAARRQKLAKQNHELVKVGRKVCGRCVRVRYLSEFSTSLSNGKGKRNSICDRCLTKMYDHENRQQEINYGFWRRRAYSCNCAARSRLQREQLRSISLRDLPYVCKPQDLAAMFVKNPECLYCRVPLTADILAVDHLTPLSRGGQHVLANLGLCCDDCNHLKHDRTKPEMFRFVKVYASRFGTSCGTAG